MTQKSAVLSSDFCLSRDNDKMNLHGKLAVLKDEDVLNYIIKFIFKIDAKWATVQAFGLSASTSIVRD